MAQAERSAISSHVRMPLVIAARRWGRGGLLLRIGHKKRSLVKIGLLSRRGRRIAILIGLLDADFIDARFA